MRARIKLADGISSRDKPDWLKIKPPKYPENYDRLRMALRKRDLHTVCEEAHCPNIPECWGGGTLTFMLMGDTCTRSCKFCAVKTAFPNGILDRNEPKKLADAVAEMDIDYVVLTSVARDDLEDGGADHLANCIKAIKEKNPSILVEILIPDFQGNVESLKKVVDAKPDVIAHNIETIEKLQRKVRDFRANYRQSLSVLTNIKKLNPKIFTKSSIMLGLGEKDEEVITAMEDLRSVGVDFLTMGQYLRPSSIHLEVVEYVHPEKFEHFKRIGEDMGFLYVASGPFVRTSYRAGELFIKTILKNNGG